jgi:hypothetical protein
VEDGAGQDGELLAAAGALADATLAGGTRTGGPAFPVGGVEEVHLGIATVGTDNAVGPPQLLKQVIGVGLALDPPANRWSNPVRIASGIPPANSS